ncbi:MAG: ribosome maturation factor RimP [Clostridia bacterium]|nr:ribosome maturation factor RimP [Clostridia bacterium]
MTAKEICEAVKQTADLYAQQNGCFVYDVEFKKEGADYVLRVILDVEDDSDGGVSIDMCENVSRALSDELDVSDPIPQAYVLEVTSPGIDRELKRESDFKRFAGRNIDIGFYKPYNGSKSVTAKLIGADGGNITVEIDGEQKQIDKKDTSSIRLSVVW